MTEEPAVDLPAELADRVRRELLDGERLLWAGRPLRGPGRAVGCVLIALGLYLALFMAVCVVVMTVASVALALEGEWAAGAFVLAVYLPPAAILGWYLPRLQFVIARQHRRCVYALTDRRAIVLTVGPISEVNAQSFGPAEAASMHRTEYPDGSGSLLFERYAVVGRTDDGVPLVRFERRGGFLEVAAVRDVEHRVRRALLPPAG